jgi:hypothetical protein
MFCSAIKKILLLGAFVSMIRRRLALGELLIKAIPLATQAEAGCHAGFETGRLARSISIVEFIKALRSV